MARRPLMPRSMLPPRVCAGRGLPAWMPRASPVRRSVASPQSPRARRAGWGLRCYTCGAPQDMGGDPGMRNGLAAVWLAVLLCACGKAPVGAVDAQRLLAADEEPGQWLALGRTWRGDRFSPLAQMNVDTIDTLGFAWEYPFRSRRGRVEHGQEATPLVVDGVIYASGPWGSAIAV